MMFNAIAVGMLAFIVSEFEAVTLHRWQDGARATSRKISRRRD
jgi:hypothetical protein